jgi:hypothetical protein
VACAQENSACTGDSECCDGLSCADGVCQNGGSGDTPDNANGGVTTLPNTGVGDQDDGVDSLLGITLAAGAAAWLFRETVRETPAAPSEED